ncbi:hypothetical protein M426DRAFT_183776 [Hypoxylon sp. CI-4A]|nr:hypothetical protein M426DRAFT_183776 [Hypoxylon sp. CI-4A]
MTSVLGKRKARMPKSEPTVSEEDAQAVFRRHFEAQFAPIENSQKAKPTTKQKDADEDAPSLLKNDLALQRLLSESHLFAGPGQNEGSMEHAGRNRHLATDLRLSALGSKTSVYKQAKMPMSHRKGIISAAAGRESKRRQEARENGIILERPVNGGVKGKSKPRKRDVAVDAPAVGKLRNGMLKLSKKDIAEIQGDDRRSGGKGGGKRRRR